RTFQFCSTAGYLLAVQFGGTSVAVGLTDLEGSIVDEILEPAEMSETVEQRTGRVEDLIDTLLERRPECRPLRGMGVGIFASVDSRTGLPNEELNVLGWGGYPIRERWESRYDVPVRVDNEVNMMALGELLGGVAQGHDTVLQVKVGSGIG